MKLGNFILLILGMIMYIASSIGTFSIDIETGRATILQGLSIIVFTLLTIAFIILIFEKLIPYLNKFTIKLPWDKK